MVLRGLRCWVVEEGGRPSSQHHEGRGRASSLIDSMAFDHPHPPHTTTRVKTWMCSWIMLPGLGWRRLEERGRNGWAAAPDQEKKKGI